VIQVAAPLSPAVALLAPPLDAPLTTKLEVQRREKKCRKNLVVGDGSLRPPILWRSERRRLKYLRREGLELTLESKPDVHLGECLKRIAIPASWEAQNGKFGGVTSQANSIPGWEAQNGRSTGEVTIEKNGGESLRLTQALRCPGS